MADKNLGPCIMERINYIKKYFSEHLENKKSYECLTTWQAWTIRNKAETEITKRYEKHEKHYQQMKKKLSKKILHRPPPWQKRTEQLYLTKKVHKIPTSYRPVISDVSSVTSFISKWLDVNFEILSLHHTQSLLRDEADLWSHLSKLNPLPQRTHIFKSDTKSMYTSICTTHTKEQLKRWIQSLLDNNTIKNYPLSAVLEVLDIIMKHSTFDFGDTSWKQLTGVLMVIPSAYQLATLSYGIH